MRRWVMVMKGTVTIPQTGQTELPVEKKMTPPSKEMVEGMAKAEGRVHKIVSLKKLNVGRKSEPSSPISPEAQEKEKYGKFKLPQDQKVVKKKKKKGSQHQIYLEDRKASNQKRDKKKQGNRY